MENNGPLIAAGGGLLLFISLFFKWIGAEGLDSLSAWEFFDLIDILLAAIALIALGIGAMLATGNTTNLPAAPDSIVTTAGLIAFSIVAAQILDPVDIQGSGLDNKFGVYLALIATIAMIVGGRQLARGVGPAEPRTRVAPPPTASAPPPPPPPPSSPGPGV